MKEYNKCFWVNMKFGYGENVSEASKNVDELKKLWGIDPNNFNADQDLKKCLIDLDTNKPSEKKIDEILTDLANNPENTNIGILCPDNKVRKLQMIRGKSASDRDDQAYLQLSDDNPVSAPPKPGRWKRFVNFFKKNKDPEVKRWNDWQKLEEASNNLKKIAGANAETSWGEQVNGSTVNEYKQSWLNEEPEEEVDRRSPEQRKCDSILERAKNGEFGELGKLQYNFIMRNRDHLAMLEWSDSGNSIVCRDAHDVSEDTARTYVASIVSLRMAAEKNISAEDYQKSNFDDLKRLVHSTQSEMSLQQMVLNALGDNGSEVIKTMNKVNKNNKLKSFLNEKSGPDREESHKGPEESHKGPEVSQPAIHQ